MSIKLATEQPFGGLAGQMNKILEQMHKSYSNFRPGEAWTPSVNLYEIDSAYLVCVDLAGVEKEKIDITVENQRLRLHGQRPVPAAPDPRDLQGQRLRVHLMEIDHGGFTREVELPLDVVQTEIEAKYINGMLWISLPKKNIEE